MTAVAALPMQRLLRSNDCAAALLERLDQQPAAADVRLGAFVDSG